MRSKRRFRRFVVRGLLSWGLVMVVVLVAISDMQFNQGQLSARDDNLLTELMLASVPATFVVMFVMFVVRKVTRRKGR